MLNRLTLTPAYRPRPEEAGLPDSGVRIPPVGDPLASTWPAACPRPKTPDREFVQAAAHNRAKLREGEPLLGMWTVRFEDDGTRRIEPKNPPVQDHALYPAKAKPHVEHVTQRRGDYTLRLVGVDKGAELMRRIAANRKRPRGQPLPDQHVQDRIDAAQTYADELNRVEPVVEAVFCPPDPRVKVEISASNEPEYETAGMRRARLIKEAGL